MYIPRHLRTSWEEADRFFPALLLTGARQVGKTTFLRTLSGPDRRYITFDDYGKRMLAKEDPRTFLERFPPPLLLDEIQYVPELLSQLKMVIDERRFRDPDHAHGLYWLTGSQRFPLMQGVSESLAGRIGIFEMPGISQAELAGRENRPFIPERCGSGAGMSAPELFRRIWNGSYPEMVRTDAAVHEVFYSSYVNTYLERDVRNLSSIRDLDRFYRFLCACAARTGQLVNQVELGRDAGVDSLTARNWLSILVSSRIVYLLPAFRSSLTARLVKTPKLHMLDTGLCAYLTRWPTPETLEAGAMSGAFFESWCVSEILKSYWNAGHAEPPLSFYRDKDRKEIDLLIEENGLVYPVEFRKSSAPGPEDAAAFSLLEHLRRPAGRGAIVCTAPERMPLPNRNADLVPASLI